MGRPSDYSPDTGEEICRRLAEGESLRTICSDEAMPSKTTVMRWLEAFPGFRDHYARARELQADHYAEQTVDIADEPPEIVMSDGESKDVSIDSGFVARQRLRVDARKWYASKLAPKKYGDKVGVEHSGNVTLEQLVTGEGSAHG